MARSDIVTQIPLDRAAGILGIDKAHFNSITTTRRPEVNTCNDLWFAYPFHKVGQASWDDLAIALRTSEDRVTDLLGYSLVPAWVYQEEQIPERPYATELTNIRGQNARLRRKSVITRRAYVIEAGVRASSLINAGNVVTLSDEDGDGYNETATITQVTTLTEGQEIHVYFPNKAGSEQWEIRPVVVSLSGGTATITFSKYLIPDPDLWEQDPGAGDQKRTIDGDNAANFLTTVDLYRVYNDPSNQAAFYNECTSCGGSGCAVCGFDVDTGCLLVRDGRRGIVAYSRATWDEDTAAFTASDNCLTDPSRLIINYRAGLVNHRMTYPYLQMEPEWERALVYYAISLMDREFAGCENTRNIWKYMTEDRAKSAGERSFTMADKDLHNKLGTTRAAVQLADMIHSRRSIQGR